MSLSHLNTCLTLIRSRNGSPAECFQPYEAGQSRYSKAPALCFDHQPSELRGALVQTSISERWRLLFSINAAELAASPCASTNPSLTSGGGLCVNSVDVYKWQHWLIPQSRGDSDGKEVVKCITHTRDCKRNQNNHRWNKKKKKKKSYLFAPHIQNYLLIGCGCAELRIFQQSLFLKPSVKWALNHFQPGQSHY